MPKRNFAKAQWRKPDSKRKCLECKGGVFPAACKAPPRGGGGGCANPPKIFSAAETAARRAPGFNAAFQRRFQQVMNESTIRTENQAMQWMASGGKTQRKFSVWEGARAMIPELWAAMSWPNPWGATGNWRATPSANNPGRIAELHRNHEAEFVRAMVMHMRAKPPGGISDDGRASELLRRAIDAGLQPHAWFRGTNLPGKICLAFFAAMHGKPKCLGVILDAPGADPDLVCPDCNDASLLFMAVQSYDYIPDGGCPAAGAAAIGVVQELCRRGAAPNVPNGYGDTPLKRAAQGGCVEIIQALLAHGADPDLSNMRTGDGIAPLYLAAAASVEATQALLAGGARVDAPNNVDGCTALHRAIRSDAYRTAAVLLEAGADPLLLSKQDATPVDFAFSNIPTSSHDTFAGSDSGLAHIWTTLLPHYRATPEFADARLRARVLYAACAVTTVELAESVGVLLANGWEANAPSTNDCRAIHIACQEGHTRIVEKLLAAGADPTVPNPAGACGFFLAAMRDHPSTVRAVLATHPEAHLRVIGLERAPPHFRKWEGSPLWLIALANACQPPLGDQSAMAGLLLSLPGVDPNYETPPGHALISGSGLLRTACEKLQPATVRLLVQHGATNPGCLCVDRQLRHMGLYGIFSEVASSTPR